MIRQTAAKAGLGSHRHISERNNIDIKSAVRALALWLNDLCLVPSQVSGIRERWYIGVTRLHLLQEQETGTILNTSCKSEVRIEMANRNYK